MMDVLTRLRLKGFKLAIDDFGTGYSSLVQLHRLPFNEIKVDRAFVTDCTTSGESRSIVRMIIDLAHALGMTAVAEGVESADALDLLRDLGCDQAQGYLIARPIDATDVPAVGSCRQPHRAASGDRRPSAACGSPTRAARSGVSDGRGYAVAPPQLEPAPAVQPKQCGPVTMGVAASARARRVGRSRGCLRHAGAEPAGRASG